MSHGPTHYRRRTSGYSMAEKHPTGDEITTGVRRRAKPLGIVVRIEVRGDAGPVFRLLAHHRNGDTVDEPITAAVAEALIARGIEYEKDEV